MKYLETEHEKRSFVITSIIFVIILILCFFLGMSYMDPPPENGIAINFGTSEFGSGDVQPTEPVASAPQPAQSAAQSTPVTDEVATQDVDDAPVINNEKTQKETPKENVKPKEQPRKPDASVLNTLDNFQNSKNAKSGEGDDNQLSDKGREDGSLYANAYYGGGDGTSGSGNKFGLNGRSIASSGKVQQDCDEVGTVVVQIEVDKTGRVVKATQSLKGTTNNASCLIKAAIATAKTYRWHPDEKAPSRQVGFIVVNFTLGE